MIIVGGIVGGAVFFTLKRFVKIYKGEAVCQCSSRDSCPSKTACCSGVSGLREERTDQIY